MEDRPLTSLKSVVTRLWAISLAIITLMLVVTAWAWHQIPEGRAFPTHWGFNGQPDAYGDKSWALFVLPGAAVILVALIIFLPLLNPRRQNITQSTKAWTASLIGMLAFIFGSHILMVLIALGYKIDVPAAMSALIGVSFVVLGSYLGKMRRNFYLGFRTPWTFSSDLAWDKTHRLGGRIFVVLGFVFVLLAFAGVRQEWIYPAALIVGTIGAGFFLTIYSYFVWKSDPDRGKPVWSITGRYGGDGG